MGNILVIIGAIAVTLFTVGLLVGIVLGFIYLIKFATASKEPFGSAYQETDTNLAALRAATIGEPDGILAADPNASNCTTDQNLIVQDKVTFKPTNLNKGCSVIYKKWSSGY